MGTMQMKDKPQFSSLDHMRSGEQYTRGQDKYCRKVMTFDYFPPNVKIVVSISLQKIEILALIAVFAIFFYLCCLSKYFLLLIIVGLSWVYPKIAGIGSTTTSTLSAGLVVID